MHLYWVFGIKEYVRAPEKGKGAMVRFFIFCIVGAVLLLIAAPTILKKAVPHKEGR